MFRLLCFSRRSVFSGSNNLFDLGVCLSVGPDACLLTTLFHGDRGEKVTPALTIRHVLTSVTAAVVRLLNPKHRGRDATASSPVYPIPVPASPRGVFRARKASKRAPSKERGPPSNLGAARPAPACVVTRKLVLVATRDAATCLAR